MIKKEQEIDWKVGGTFVYKKSNYDHCQIVKILKVGEYLIECENLEGVKYTLLNCQINFKPLWFSEDFYLNLGLMPCEKNIFKNLDLNYCYYNLFESQRDNNNFYLFSILKNEKNEIFKNIL